MKIATIFSILLLLHITSYLVSAQIIDILLGSIINLLNGILGGLLNSADTRKLAQILLTIKRDYDVELSNEEITEKVDHFLQLRTDINGTWDFEMTVFFFLPIEFQLKLGGARFEEVQVVGQPGLGPPIEDKSLEEAPSKGVDNEKDQHPRDKRASCTYKNVFSAPVNWSGCAPIINRITHQGQCGSCWAIGPTGAFTDRLCIQRAKYGLKTPNDPFFIYSALDALACSGGGNCSGGQPTSVWN
ncbi:unnamed protein product [Meloidogyne enterolobii]|uniref:Uncharacterized protein n=1 Tax=Meloidogyne enterolobii TaxID=390850 RepID=A0ACB1AKT0_MELEN